MGKAEALRQSVLSECHFERGSREGVAIRVERSAFLEFGSQTYCSRIGSNADPSTCVRRHADSRFAQHDSMEEDGCPDEQTALFSYLTTPSHAPSRGTRSTQSRCDSARRGPVIRQISMPARWSLFQALAP